MRTADRPYIFAVNPARLKEIPGESPAQWYNKIPKQIACEEVTIMAKQITDCTVLHNGVKMPWLGLGVWKVKEGDEVVRSVAAALRAGYRSIDTAAVYGNEEGVGKAIHQSGIPREEKFITTKVWNADQGYETTLQAFEASRKKLGLEYLDLYLVHWPVKEKYKETWKALEKLYKDGLVRAIGVSNFQIHHLQDVMDNSEVVPMVNQVEYHPLLTQKELLQFCQRQNIQLEAWSPLMQGNLDNPTLAELAEKYKKTPAQIVLRWDLQNGVVTIPKSITEKRIIENANIFDFELSREDMDKIDALNINKRFGPDPDNFDF
jgi:diketogulonate reductase-like aldo/keto reductase